MSSNQIRSDIKKKYDLFPYACHITRIENLEGIFRSEYLKCKRLLTQGSYVDISDEVIQERRQEKTVLDTGLTLFDFVPFYLTYKSPMVSAKRSENEQLVYIQIGLEIFAQTRGCVLTDGNAAAHRTKFVHFDTLEALSILDRDVLYKPYGGDLEKKRKKGAELLVPEKVHISSFNLLAFFSDDGKRKGLEIFSKLGKECAVQVAPRWFYPQQ